MLSDPKQVIDFASLANKVGQSTIATADLFRHVMADGCTRLQTLKRSGKTANIDRLIESHAWCDTALALIAIELPVWSIRRLIYDGGEWLCSLSRQPSLPIELDDTAEFRHRVLPLAILGALLEARQRTRGAHAPVALQIRPVSAHIMCCDNFA